MSLFFKNVQLLSYNIENQFFDTEFRFNQLKNISIEGLVYDLQQTSGAASIFSQISGLREDLKNDYEYIFINGHNFGKGKISSFSFPEDRFVKTAKYNIDIQIRDEGNLEYLSGNYFSGLSGIFEQNTNPAQFIKDFSETIDISRSSILNSGGRKLGDFSYNHSVDISFDVGSGNLYPNVNMAHKFTKEMFEKNIDFGFLETGTSGLFGSNFKTLKSQNIDMINGRFSMSESFDAEYFDPSINYSMIENVGFQTQTDGYINANYDAKIISLTNNHEFDISGALSYVKTGAFLKTSGIFNEYYPDASGLIENAKLSENTNKNIFEGTVDYSTVFSNNPAIHENYRFEYEQIISEDSNQVVNISENGTIIGKDPNGFNDAKTAYNSLATKSIVKSRAEDLYQSEYGVLYDLFENSKNYEESPSENTITYSYSWSDKDIGLNSIIQSKEINISTEYPVLLKNNFNIFGQKEIYQPVGNITINKLPSKSVDLNFTAKKSASYSNILTEMESQINSYAPSETDCFVESFSYNYDQNTKNLSANMVWKWPN